MGSLQKTLAAVIVATLFTPLAHAADYSPAGIDPPAPAENQLAELGTGWYLRGGVGWARDSGLKLTWDGQVKSTGTKNGWVADIGGGYQFNNWLRADATFETRNFTRNNGTGPLQVNGVAGASPCQIGAAPVKNALDVIVGSTPVYESCADAYRSRVSVNTVMLNGYVDLGTWSSITPYIGAGIGATRVRNTGSDKWYAANGTDHYDVTWVDPFTTISYHGFRDKTYRKDSYNLAWALMAGAAIDVAPHVKLDVGYRYASYGDYRAINVATGNFVTKKITAQEFRAGVRYLID